MRIDIGAVGDRRLLPNEHEVRLAFMSAQQSLRALKCLPQPLLNAVTFPFADAPGIADIDFAIALLEREVLDLKVARMDYLSSRRRLTHTETI